MFACLQVARKEGLPRSFLRDWRKPTPVLRRVDLPGSAPFFVVDVSMRRGELQWSDLETALGRLRTRLLLPNHLNLPKESSNQGKHEGMKKFQARRLPLLLCFRQAQQLLQLTKIPAQQLRVTVADPHGVLSHQIDALVPLAGSLRVFSPNIKQYRATAERLQQRFGAQLILSDSPACFAQSHVTIAEDLSLFTGRERGLIFTPDESPLPDCHVVRGETLLLPDYVKNVLPSDISPLLFASALFELCGLKEMERLSFETYKITNYSQDFSLETLSYFLDENYCPPRAY